MRLLLCLILFALIILLVRASTLTRDPLSFIPLLMKIREHYGTSTMFFLHRGDAYDEYGDLAVTYVVHTWSRYFGHRGIPALDVHFKRMYRMQRYFKQIVKPLIIVLISGPDVFLEFAETTKSFKMNFATWILLFLSSPRHAGEDYCHDPVGNPLNIVFNSQVLALCLHDPVIREWYSVDGKTTTLSDWATWNRSSQCITPLNNLSLYERRKNLEGTVLRGVITRDSKYFKIVNGQLEGYFGKIFSELMNAMNFTIDIVATASQYGAYNMTTKKFSGALDIMVSGNADIGLADFSMTNERLNYVDYLIPLILSRNCLYIKQPEMFVVKWYAFFQTFNYSVWLSMAVVTILCVIVLIIIKMILKPNITMRVMCEDIFNVWGILCQQGLPELPEHTSLRIVYFSILCTAFVVFAAYSASLISFLTACIRFLPFLSLEDFVRDGSYSLLITQGSADYDVFVYSKNHIAASMVKLLKSYHLLPRSVAEGFRKICKNPKLAFYTSEEIRKASAFQIPCKIASINAGRVDSLSIILAKESPYTDLLNHHLHKFLSTGVLNRVKISGLVRNFDKDIVFQPVEFYSIATVLTILAGGIVLAAIMLALEIRTYKRKHNTKSLTPVIKNSPLGIPFTK